MDKKFLLYLLPSVFISVGVWLFSTGNIDRIYAIHLITALFLTYIGAIFDLKEKKISNKYILFMFYIFLFLTAVELLVDFTVWQDRLFRAGLGIASAFLLFITVYLLSKGGMGGADVKLMSVLGLYIGYEMVLTTTLLAAVLTSIVGGILIFLKKMNKKSPIPFVPFIYLALLITVFLYIGGA